MSRVGKIPVAIPQGVEVKISPRMSITVKGPKGQMDLDPEGRVSIRQEGDTVLVERPDDTKPSRAYHGLYQRLLTNMVMGVSVGFKKELEIQGVGYRAQAQGRGITLNLGFSHPIQMEPPEGITFEVPEPTRIVVSGHDKQVVGQAAANIRALRPPEPYKGKGIRYRGEQVRRKEGKTGGS